MFYVIDGLLMALADSVPGVSGGTIAFLLGFYDRFITSLRHLLSSDVQKRKQAWRFALVFGSGWGIGMILAMLLLDGVVETQIYPVSSLFLGFVLASIPVVAWKEKECLKGDARAWPMLIVGFLLVFLITKLSAGNHVQLNLTKMTLASGGILFIAAAAAASAMVLPGISGSSLLMAFGLYLPVVSQVSALLHGELSALPMVAVFSLGALAGLFGVVRLLNRALKSFRAHTVYAVIGMMIASLYAVAMGPMTLRQPQAMLSAANWKPGFFVLGCVVIVGLTFLEKAQHEINNPIETEG